MPPIPIYTDAPITAAKANGITPQTAEDATSVSDGLNQGQNAYPAAQPAPAPAPAPTSGATGRPRPPPPTSTTQTAQSQYDGPPPPQPAARPIAPTQTATSDPPLPQPSLSSPPSIAPPTTTMPPQMAIPPPTTNAAPTHSTYVASPTTTRGPTTVSLGPVAAVTAPPQTSQYSVAEPGRQSFEHPPGYVQNPYAMELSAAQRASLEAQQRDERPARTSISGILRGGGDDASPSASGGGVWDAVKGFASAAGQKFGEVDEAVWKKINKS